MPLIGHYTLASLSGLIYSIRSRKYSFSSRMIYTRLPYLTILYLLMVKAQNKDTLCFVKHFVFCTVSLQIVYQDNVDFPVGLIKFCKLLKSTRFHIRSVCTANSAAAIYIFISHIIEKNGEKGERYRRKSVGSRCEPPLLTLISVRPSFRLATIV